MCSIDAAWSQGPDRTLQDCLNRQQASDGAGGNCVIGAMATAAKVWLRVAKRTMAPLEKCTVQGLMDVEGLSAGKQSELAGQSMNVCSLIPALAIMRCIFDQ